MSQICDDGGDDVDAGVGVGADDAGAGSKGRQKEEEYDVDGSPEEVAVPVDSHYGASPCQELWTKSFSLK